ILYNGHYLLAYGFPEVNVGDLVTIFGVHEFSGGFIKMSGAAPHAYVTVDWAYGELSLYLYSTEAVANLALRNTYSGNILNYYAIIGRLVKQSGECYLTDGLNTILLVLANPSLEAVLAPFTNTDVEIKMFNYEYSYTEELWKAIVVAGDDIIEAKVLSGAELTIILKAYIENDFNCSHTAGFNYSFSTTHPIYGGTIEVTVDPISSMYAVINDGQLTLTPSAVQYAVTLQVEILCGVLHVTDTIEFDVSPGFGPPTN
ncbi:MAG TPA: hypothetical protein VJZ51_01875, partial [Bacilli bacterium]|nr:hypothetical protein [Bacilli bacterium]